MTTMTTSLILTTVNYRPLLSSILQLFCLISYFTRIQQRHTATNPPIHITRPYVESTSLKTGSLALTPQSHCTTANPSSTSLVLISTIKKSIHQSCQWHPYLASLIWSAPLSWHCDLGQPTQQIAQLLALLKPYCLILNLITFLTNVN